MLLSLPPVLLVWAVVTFTGSVLAYAMQDAAEKVGVFRFTTSNLEKTFNEQNSAGVAAWVTFSLLTVFLVIVFAALYTFSGLWSFQQGSRIRRPARFIAATLQRSFRIPKASQIAEMA
jgi:hypothetical protein